MNKRTTFYLGLIFLSLLLFSCKPVLNESEEYQIISEILNHSYGHETDDENGLGWIDTSKSYNSLRVRNHTNLRELDIEILNDYLNFNNLSDFAIEDFQKYREWDIKKIKDYYRYLLETDTDKGNESRYIGSIQFSSISFNKDLDHAIIYTTYYCGGECGEGLVFRLIKTDKWTVEKVETLWVS